MSWEATGSGVQHEGFDVDEKISLFNFAGFSLNFQLLREILRQLFDKLFS